MTGSPTKVEFGSRGNDRGVEGFTIAYSLLDVPPYGRQEDWEDLPPG